MNWYACEIYPVNDGWEHLLTVKQVFARIVKCGSGQDMYHSNSSDVRKFFDSWETAKKLAADKGWEGDFRDDPCVF